MSFLGVLFDFFGDLIGGAIGQYMAQRSWRVIAVLPVAGILLVSIMALVVTHSMLALAWVVLMIALAVWLTIDLIRNPPDVSL